MRGHTYDGIQIGDKASFSKTITEADIHSFSAITADFNPIHVDEVYSTQSTLGKKVGGRIAQGMLSASLFSTLVGMYLPGKGALYVSQSCHFRKPVMIGDTLRAECEVLEKMEKGRVRIATRCVNQHNDVVVDGEAIAIAARHQEDVL